jgi:hypothetical protein
MIDHVACPNCRAAIPKGVTYCAGCGLQMPPIVQASPRPAWQAAAPVRTQGNPHRTYSTVTFIIFGMPSAVMGAVALATASGFPETLAFGIGGACIAVASFLYLARSYSKR